MHALPDLKRTANASAFGLLPNRWDAAALVLIVGMVAMMAIGFEQTTAPMATLSEHPVSLDPAMLPEYALRTTLRMLAAMVASLLFTFTYATLAARNRRAEKLLIPALDILQSVPVLGFISFTVTFFLALMPSRVMGAALVAWANKFRMENTASANAPQSWLLDLIRRTRLVHRLLLPLGAALAALARLRLSPASSAPAAPDEPTATRTRWVDLCWNAGIMALALYLLWRVTSYVSAGVSWRDVGEVLVLGGITLLRVTVLIALSSLLWVPLGILIGLRPKWAQAVQPLAQFLAAFPANLLFPVFVIGIAHWHLNPDVWLSPLIVLGTQWYILFNVIAGASAYPNDYREVAANFGIRGWQWWRRCMLPAVFPYYVTGAITASGGAWNASIVSEVVQWGDTQIVAHGLGAYIAQNTAAGDFPRIILGVSVMALFVTLFNRLVWRHLYAYADTHLRMN